MRLDIMIGNWPDYSCSDRANGAWVILAILIIVYIETSFMFIIGYDSYSLFVIQVTAGCAAVYLLYLDLTELRQVERW